MTQDARRASREGDLKAPSQGTLGEKVPERESSTFRGRGGVRWVWLGQSDHGDGGFRGSGGGSRRGATVAMGPGVNTGPPAGVRAALWLSLVRLWFGKMARLLCPVWGKVGAARPGCGSASRETGKFLGVCGYLPVGTWVEAWWQERIRGGWVRILGQGSRATEGSR